jgi:hypothetical protein
VVYGLFEKQRLGLATARAPMVVQGGSQSAWGAEIRTPPFAHGKGAELRITVSVEMQYADRTATASFTATPSAGPVANAPLPWKVHVVGMSDERGFTINELKVNSWHDFGGGDDFTQVAVHLETGDPRLVGHPIFASIHVEGVFA